jgi:hypothetical protein
MQPSSSLEEEDILDMVICSSKTLHLALRCAAVSCVVVEREENNKERERERKLWKANPFTVLRTLNICSPLFFSAEKLSGGARSVCCLLCDSFSVCHYYPWLLSLSVGSFNLTTAQEGVDYL